MSSVERHCGQKGCSCLHEMCYAGWIDNQPGYTTAPCVVCKQSLYDVLSVIPRPGLRNDADQSRIRNRYKVAL